jgi:iron(III) transport system ATP-binding protein
MAYLKLSHITKKYSGSSFEAIQNVSFEVAQGEILALVGESGSGKTTLLRIIAGLEHPNSGAMLLQENVILDGNYSLPPDKRQIGMVFQDYALFPHLTILENVCYGLTHLGKEARARAQEVLKIVDLNEDLNKYPHQLSGGQQQRVALARAIAPNPTIILMDEPFSNLDAVLKDQVREEIRLIIKKAGLTAIFVTHDTRDALSTADRIAILYKGKLQQIGSPKALYEQPSNDYVANFFGKQNDMTAVAMDGGFHTPYGFLPDSKAEAYFGSVRILFRPEDGRLATYEQHKMTGQVFKVAYFGDHQLVKISDKSGKRISIKCPPQIQIRQDEALSFVLDHYRVEAIKD